MSKSELPTFEEHKEYVNYLNDLLSNGKTPTIDILVKYYSEAVYTLKDCPEQRDFVFGITNFIKEWCSILWEYEGDNFFQLYWDTMLFEAQNRVLDSYLLYLEKNREYEDKFYEPKRKCFLKIGLIQALQDAIDDKIDILTISLPPGSGKTTLEKFFHSAVIGWYPEDFNLFYSHSADITRMYYDGVLDILQDSTEYTWNEIFPELHVTATNAKMQTINVGKYKPFQNLMTGSVGSNLAGKVRASKFLFVDDLVGKLSDALNNNILDGIWNAYSSDARQRKITKGKHRCKEIIIGTRWSVHDPIGRIIRMAGHNPRIEVINVPCIDPVTGESNFAFDVNGFTVDFYNDIAQFMDKMTFDALYLGKPVEREGLLFNANELMTFDETELSRIGECEEIIAQVDCKGKGTDYMVMGVFQKYGDYYYMVDCICDDQTDYDLQYERLKNCIIENKAKVADFESNSGGDRVAEEVGKRLINNGWICNIRTPFTSTNKESKIQNNAWWVIKHVKFKDSSMYGAKSDYGKFMDLLTTYSSRGKNLHDDVPDMLTSFADRVVSSGKVAKVEACSNPFAGLGNGVHSIYDRRYYGYY